MKTFETGSSEHSPDAHFDVVVAGGGMVGSLLAAALATGLPATSSRSAESRSDDSSNSGVRSRPLSICVLESSAPAPYPSGESAQGDEPPYDIRVSAVSVASERMFRSVGAWGGVVARRTAPFRTMRVWDGSAEPPGSITFEAEDAGVAALGHIVENRVLQLALLERLQQLPNVTLRCPASLERFHDSADGDSVAVTLGDGDTLRARLLVGADGARSTVRRLAGIGCQREPYEQGAMVATVDTALPQQSITWQRFLPTGPQAMLPLQGSRASLVWYHEQDEIARLSALDETAFIDALHAHFPAELGRIERVHQRGSFPIAKAHADRYVGHRLALIGDAAHTVHPLAGQGVNLGMLDAGALAETVLDAVRAGRDIGSDRVLRGYERWRRADNALMIEIVDGFHRAFGPAPEVLQRSLPASLHAALPGRLRGLALDIADRSGPAKRLVSRYAMGLAGDLPAIARAAARAVDDQSLAERDRRVHLIS